MDIQLFVQKNNRILPLPFYFEKMINAGFTGRDQAEVRHHLDELSAKGIEVPSETPVLYPVLPSALTSADRIMVYGEETSAEIEYVLFVKNRDEVYVGIGSDHTDRNLEEVDIPRAKQISPNVVSPMVWELSDVKHHWDSLSMECTVRKNGDSVLYQKGQLGLLMSPGELMDLIADKIDSSIDNSVIFSGTLKMETDEFVFADSVSVLLSDAELNRSIETHYHVEPMGYLK